MGWGGGRAPSFSRPPLLSAPELSLILLSLNCSYPCYLDTFNDTKSCLYCSKNKRLSSNLLWARLHNLYGKLRASSIRTQGWNLINSSALTSDRQVSVECARANWDSCSEAKYVKSVFKLKSFINVRNFLKGWTFLSLEISMKKYFVRTVSQCFMS